MISLSVCSRTLSPSILTHLPLRSPFSGDIGTLVIPEGMQFLELSDCPGLTGKTELGE